MKNKQRLLIIILAAVILVAIIGIVFSVIFVPKSSSETPETQSNTSLPLTPSRLYLQAVDEIDGDFLVTVSCRADMIVGDVRTQTTESTVHFNNFGTDKPVITADTAIIIDKYRIDTHTFFGNNTGYVSVADGAFYGEMTAQEYCFRYAPSCILDAELYKVISSQTGKNDMTIVFSEPTACEAWAAPNGAILIEALGSATLVDGKLTQSTYSVTYQLGTVTHRREYQASFTVCDDVISLPEADAYTEVSAPEAAVLLEQAYGYLMAAPALSANITDSILCQTFGDELSRSVELHTSEDDENFKASLNISMQQKNSSRGGEVTQKKQSVVYENGVYTMVIDDGEPSSKTTITPGYMQSYCQDYLVGTILMPKEVSGIQVVETEDTYTYHFTSVSDELASRIRQRASQDLYGEGGLLENLYTTETLGGYLTVEKDSGVPIASGISYTGTHLFDGNPYQLVFITDQVYNYTQE